MSFSHPAANSVRFFCFCVWLPSFLTSAYILCLLGQPSGESRTQSSIPNSRRSYRLIAAVPLDETLITPPLIVWSSLHSQMKRFPQWGLCLLEQPPPSMPHICKGAVWLIWTGGTGSHSIWMRAKTGQKVNDPTGQNSPSHRIWSVIWRRCCNTII